MTIYEVIFWGSLGKRDEKDTLYLVRAMDFQSAVQEVIRNGAPEKFDGTGTPLVDAVYEVGQDLCPYPNQEARILRGPYFAFAYNYGWRSWSRKTDDELTPDVAETATRQ
jgi:hypothetical protein